MPRKSTRRSSRAAASSAASRSNNRNDGTLNETNNNDNQNQNQNQEEEEEEEGRRSVASHVRDRQRRVAEREAARLARPEKRNVVQLQHADPKKSAVSSTPFGRFTNRTPTLQQNQQQEKEEWCGPFSVARQMIAKREEAKRKREEELQQREEEEGGVHHPLDGLVQELELERQRKAHPSLSWKSSFHQQQQQQESSSSSSSSLSSKLSLYAKRQKRAELWSKQSKRTVPSLFQLCVNFVVQHFEHVESLGSQVDNDVRVAICKQLVGNNAFTPTALASFVDPYMETLEIVDCSGIPQTVFAKTMETTFAPYGYLRHLLLTHAGRCFGPLTVQALVSSSNKHKLQLQCLSISGAYLLSDQDSATLLKAMSSSLCSLEFQTCPLLGDAFATTIAQLGTLKEDAAKKSPGSTTSTNKSIYYNDSITRSTSTSSSSSSSLNQNCLLELSLQELELGTSALATIASAKTTLCHLQSLKLKNMKGLTDDIVLEFMKSCCHTTTDTTNSTMSSLELLDLSQNWDLTDACLSGIRQYHSTSLRSLNLSGLKQLSAIGLEALFTPVCMLEDDLILHPPPTKLTSLNLGSLHSETVTDAILQLIVQRTSNGTSSTELQQELTSTSIAPVSSYAIRNANKSSLSLSSSSSSVGGGLVTLDVQGSLRITDTMLEQVAASSSRTTLQELNISYCPNISDKGLGYFISQMGLQLRSIELWGCAQITDDVLDGHARRNDPTLEIIGAWMKQSTSSRGTMR